MEKILVIEDETDIRENLEIILSDSGYEVITAESGDEGVEKAIANLPNIILCDRMMPGMSGDEVLTALRGNSTTANIPFIFLTAKVRESDRRKGMELGAADYIEKPFRIASVLQAIATQLENRRLRLGEYEKIKKIIGNGAFDVLNNDSQRTRGLIELAIEQAKDLKTEVSAESWEELFQTLDDLKTCLIDRMYASSQFLEYVEKKLSI